MLLSALIRRNTLIKLRMFRVAKILVRILTPAFQILTPVTLNQTLIQLILLNQFRQLVLLTVQILQSEPILHN
jgi:hypothetical protein